MEGKEPWVKTGVSTIQHMAMDEHNGFIYIAAASRLLRICDRSMDRLVKYMETTPYLSTFPHVIMRLLGEYCNDSGFVELVCEESTPICGVYVDSTGCVWLLNWSGLIAYHLGIASTVRRFTFKLSVVDRCYIRRGLVQKSDGTFIVLSSPLFHYPHAPHQMMIEFIRIPVQDHGVSNTLKCEESYSFLGTCDTFSIDASDRLQVAGKGHITQILVKETKSASHSLRMDPYATCVGITFRPAFGLRLVFFATGEWLVCNDSCALLIRKDGKKLRGSRHTMDPRKYISCATVGLEYAYMAWSDGAVDRIPISAWDTVLQQANILLTEIKEQGRCFGKAILLSNGHLILLKTCEEPLEHEQYYSY